MIWVLFGLVVFFALGVERPPRRPIRMKEPNPNPLAQWRDGRRCRY